jgi:hypothetical protein
VVARCQSLGLQSREYSLASKTLHRLMPSRVPVHDNDVRTVLGVRASSDHPQAYRQITLDVFALAREAEQ